MAEAKVAPSNPILREIVAKKEQYAQQILRGEPKTYDEYQSALGAYKTLLHLENFTRDALKQGDHVD